MFINPPGFPQGLIQRRERPLGGGVVVVKTHPTPCPYRALKEGGRSPSASVSPDRPRLPRKSRRMTQKTQEMNSKGSVNRDGGIL